MRRSKKFQKANRVGRANVLNILAGNLPELWKKGIFKLRIIITLYPLNFGSILWGGGLFVLVKLYLPVCLAKHRNSLEVYAPKCKKQLL